jgi:hypothetical protein
MAVHGTGRPSVRSDASAKAVADFVTERHERSAVQSVVKLRDGAGILVGANVPLDLITPKHFGGESTKAILALQRSHVSSWGDGRSGTAIHSEAFGDVIATGIIRVGRKSEFG